MWFEMLRPLPSYQPDCARQCNKGKSANKYLTTPRTMLLHAMQEFADDLGAGPDEHLTLARFFGIVDGV